MGKLGLARAGELVFLKLKQMKTYRYSDVVKYQKWAFIAGFFTGTFATAISLILYFIL